MISILVQLFVAALAIAVAGLRGLHFASNDLTDFELQRRIKAGDEAAKRELELRTERPQLDAFRRILVLLLTIIIVILLASAYSFFVAIIWAFVWLVAIELLSSRQWLQVQDERLATQYQDQILRATQALRPVLRFVADRQVLGRDKSMSFYSKEELLRAVDDSAHILDKDEKLLIHQALAYQDILVKDIMTPRSVVVTIDADDTIGPLLLDRMHKSGHSRLPVIRDDLDHVQGILYLHNLVPLNPRFKKVFDAMSPKVFYVQQDQSLDHVLQAFLRTKHHLFMVVNEFEEVVGVISIEDVLETIIGRKIVDEFDQYDDLRAVAKLAANKLRKERTSIAGD